MTRCSGLLTLMIVTTTVLGCGDGAPNLFAKSEKQRDFANALTSVLGSTSQIVSQPAPSADGGPSLESVKQKLDGLNNGLLDLELTGLTDQVPTAVVVQLLYASTHVRAPLIPTGDAGRYSVALPVSEAFSKAWPVFMALVDDEGRAGEPINFVLNGGRAGQAGVIQTLAPHTGATRALAFGSGDAAGSLVTGGHDNDVVIWDLESGRRTHRFQGHVDWVLDVSIFADGLQVVSGSQDHHVRIWDVATQRVLATIGDALGPVRAVVVSPDDQRFATGSADGWIRIYDRDGTPIAQRDTGMPVNALTYASDKLLVAGMGGILDVGQVQLFDPNGLAPGLSQDTAREVTAVTYDADGERFAAVFGAGNYVVKAGNGATGEPLKFLVPPEVLGQQLDSQVSPRDTVPSIAFVPGQQLLAGVTLTGLITFWNLETGTIVVNRSIGLPAMAVAFSDDGGTLALGAESGATAVVALDAGFGEIPNP